MEHITDDIAKLEKVYSWLQPCSLSLYNIVLWTRAHCGLLMHEVHVGYLILGVLIFYKVCPLTLKKEKSFLEA